jgi:hypothetical protein
VARSVDEVELIGVAVPGRVGHPDRVQFDGDAALALQVHGVEQLLAHLPLFDRAGRLDQPVRQRGFAMVDVGDDAEIPNLGLGHGGKIGGEAGKRGGGEVQRIQLLLCQW